MFNKFEKELLKIINIMAVVLITIGLLVGYFDYLEGISLALLLVCDVFEICGKVINKHINKNEEA